MHTVRDNAKVELVRKTERPLNDVVVPRQYARAAISQVREQRQPGVDARPQLIE
jgi:hypothetical protein